MDFEPVAFRDWGCFSSSTSSGRTILRMHALSNIMSAALQNHAIRWKEMNSHIGSVHLCFVNHLFLMNSRSSILISKSVDSGRAKTHEALRDPKHICPSLTGGPALGYVPPAMIVRVLKTILEALKYSGPRDSFN